MEETRLGFRGEGSKLYSEFREEALDMTNYAKEYGPDFARRIKEAGTDLIKGLPLVAMSRYALLRMRTPGSPGMGADLGPSEKEEGFGMEDSDIGKKGPDYRKYLLPAVVIAGTGLVLSTAWQLGYFDGILSDLYTRWHIFSDQMGDVPYQNGIQHENVIDPATYSQQLEKEGWIIYGDGATTHVYVNSAHTAYATRYPTSSASSGITLGALTSGGRNPNQVNLDWIFIRKRVSSEPTFSIGAEETV